MPIQKLYHIDIGFDAEKAEWYVQTLSLADKKIHAARGTKLGPLFDRVKKTVRKKQQQAQKFPLPEENRVITLPPQIVSPKLILPNGN